MIKNMILAAMAVGFLATSCSDDDDNASNTNLSLSLKGLESLGDDYVYEGWVIVDGAPISTGVFSVNSSGDLSQTNFAVDATTLAAASRFVLSVEPAGETGAAALAPADTKLLVGDFSDSTAELNTNIVGDFSNAAGTFFLRTPTDEMGMNNDNDMNGVWFGTPGMPPMPNLTLPTLPAGWIYEGWVIGESGPITTGTFSSFNVADNEAPYSGTAQTGPPIPGEDFFNNAPAGETFPLDVRGRTVVVSVEPVPDNSPAPFVLKPLLGVSGQETAPASHTLGQNLGSFPSGTVIRR